MFTNYFKDLKEKYLQTDKRFLGIDYGTKNIGLAISDTSRTIASPYKTLQNKNYNVLFKEFEEIIKEFDIEVIIIGLPLQMDGQMGDTAQKVELFKKELEKNFPTKQIFLFDERLTSKIGEKMLIKDFDLSRKKRAKILDKISASYILQNFLDKMNFN